MTAIAIIQARMGSTRLPGKVLADVNGMPLLWHVVQRARAARLVDQVVVALPYTPEDLDLGDRCSEMGVDWVAPTRSAPGDVLSRLRDIAKKCAAEDIIVRLTGDCPLVPPGAIDQAIAAVRQGWDYVTNAAPSSGWCDGEDVEAFTPEVLTSLERNASSPADREHVTTAIRRRGLGFRCGLLMKSGDVFPLPLGTHGSDWSTARLSVNTPEDLERVRLALAAEGA